MQRHHIRGGTKNVASTLQQWNSFKNSTKKTPPKTAIDDLGQSGENFYQKICVLLKNIRDSTDKDEYQREIVFYPAGNKNVPAKGKWIRSTE